jgi:hypothetical protein
MAIIWDQPAKEADEEIEQIIEEAEQATEILEDIQIEEDEVEPEKSPSRGFGN